MSTTQPETDAAALGNLRLSHIILVTDALHLLRAWLTFRGLGLTVTCHIEPIPPGVAHQERSRPADRRTHSPIPARELGLACPSPLPP